MALTIRSSRRVRAGVLALATAALGLVAAGVATAPGAGAAAPAITVTPSSGLSDGQTVTVHGTGYTPNVHTINVIQCPVSGAGESSCNVSGAKLFQSTDASGSFTVSLKVVAKLGSIDCTKVACMIDAHEGTSATSGNDASVVIHFGSTSAASGGSSTGSSTGSTTGTGGTSGTTTGTGGTTGGSGATTGGQPTGANTGHQDLGSPRALLALLLAGAGVVLLAGGLGLHLRRTRARS